MSRGSWLVFLAVGCLAGLVSTLAIPGLIFPWLTVWPIAISAELIRDRFIGSRSILLGYFASVSIRVVIGLALAMILDRVLNSEFGENRVYWFGWVANYLISLTVETVLLVRDESRKGNGVA